MSATTIVAPISCVASDVNGSLSPSPTTSLELRGYVDDPASHLGSEDTAESPGGSGVSQLYRSRNSVACGNFAESAVPRSRRACPARFLIASVALFASVRAIETSREQARHWKCSQFAISNKKGDVVALLRSAALSIKQLGAIDILDITFNQESGGSENEMTLTVYFTLNDD